MICIAEVEVHLICAPHCACDLYPIKHVSTRCVPHIGSMGVPHIAVRRVQVLPFAHST